MLILRYSGVLRIILIRVYNFHFIYFLFTRKVSIASKLEAWLKLVISITNQSGQLDIILHTVPISSTHHPISYLNPPLMTAIHDGCPWCCYNRPRRDVKVHLHHTDITVLRYTSSASWELASSLEVIVRISICRCVQSYRVNLMTNKLKKFQ